MNEGALARLGAVGETTEETLRPSEPVAAEVVARDRRKVRDTLAGGLVESGAVLDDGGGRHGGEVVEAERLATVGLSDGVQAAEEEGGEVVVHDGLPQAQRTLRRLSIQ
ncbi:hypothetical protein [Methylobacterium sp. ap11]|uniref:hypothetical protein n=1 Tax=Methylobacterium sp. ap11 TaxID=1761799 RepID=UPI001160A795|nr:hypothetical protein [Methylobacterium sp. ap11]